MKWRNFGPYIFATEPDPLKDFWHPRKQPWGIVGISATIVSGQGLLYGLEAYGERKNVLPDMIFGCGMDIVTICAVAVVACILHFASLRRNFHPMFAFLFALLLSVWGTGCAFPAMILGGGGSE